MGAFHTICTFLSILGKRFGDAGLRDVCVEAEEVAEGSIGQVLEGRHYNRAVRMHKLVYEALLKIQWEGFLEWLDEDEKNKLTEVLKILDISAHDVTNTTWNEISSNPSLLESVKRFKKYQEVLRKDNGTLSEFWISYMDNIEILLGMIRASREGNWHLHLASIRAMIPWCFAYDRINYSRYLTYYFAQMSRLEYENPYVYNNFMSGGFSVQIGTENTFGKILVDQTIEETINKDTKTQGGTCRFSLNEGTIRCYYLN